MGNLCPFLGFFHFCHKKNRDFSIFHDDLLAEGGSILRIPRMKPSSTAGKFLAVISFELRNLQSKIMAYREKKLDFFSKEGSHKMCLKIGKSVEPKTCFSRNKLQSPTGFNK